MVRQERTLLHREAGEVSEAKRRTEGVRRACAAKRLFSSLRDIRPVFFGATDFAHPLRPASRPTSSAKAVEESHVMKLAT